MQTWPKLQKYKIVIMFHYLRVLELPTCGFICKCWDQNNLIWCKCIVQRRWDSYPQTDFKSNIKDVVLFVESKIQCGFIIEPCKLVVAWLGTGRLSDQGWLGMAGGGWGLLYNAMQCNAMHHSSTPWKGSALLPCYISSAWPSWSKPLNRATCWFCRCNG